MGSRPREKEGRSDLSPPYLITEGAGPVWRLAALEAESGRPVQEPWEPGGQAEEDGKGGEPHPCLSEPSHRTHHPGPRDRGRRLPCCFARLRDGVHILLQGSFW